MVGDVEQAFRELAGQGDQVSGLAAWLFVSLLLDMSSRIPRRSSEPGGWWGWGERILSGMWSRHSGINPGLWG